MTCFCLVQQACHFVLISTAPLPTTLASRVSFHCLVNSFFLPSRAMLMDESAPPSNNKICHILPCSIDYEGMAPIHIYFQPSDEGQAQFRGRKLLAKPPVAVQGKVLMRGGGGGGASHGSNSRANLTFHQIQEWHHLDDPLQLTTTSQTRVETAQTWCHVARAVHEEIPVDD